VLAATALVFLASTLVMLYVILLLAEYGANLPMVGSLPLAAPPEMVPLLAEDQIFATLAAVHVTATGLALILTSTTVDTALLITSKAVTVIITALLGFVGGHMIYLQLNENTAMALQPLTPAILALVGFFLLSTLLSVQNLRQLGALRFAVALGLIIMGPMLLVWL
jgi:tetrahydromethanopterin S-methyltransferase subunit D